jgi:hypothetical protein
MPEPKTLDEIAREWFSTHDGMCIRTVKGQTYEQHLRAALQQAYDLGRAERDKELHQRISDVASLKAEELIAALDARSGEQEKKP